MKHIFLKFFSVFFLSSLLLVSSCKKSDNNGIDDLPNIGKNEISMMIDGKPWKATMSVMMSFPPEDVEEDYYLVALVGSEVNIEEGADVDVEEVKGLTLYFAVPSSKFKNPIGVYNFTDAGEITPQYPAFAMFTGYGNSSNEISMYATIGADVGSLKLDKFKTGKQSLFGHVISEDEVYTHLAGTFSTTLTEIVNNETDKPKVLKITNGKFNVDNSFGLGGLFGKYSDLKHKLETK